MPKRRIFDDNNWRKSCAEQCCIRPVFWRINGNKKDPNFWPDLAVRDGDWKLVTTYDGQRVEFHNLKANRTEDISKDQSKDHPEIVARLKKQALDWNATLPTKADPSCLAKPQESEPKKLSEKAAPKSEAPAKDRSIPFNRWDTNKDEFLTLEEYKAGQNGGPDLEVRYNRQRRRRQSQPQGVRHAISQIDLNCMKHILITLCLAIGYSQAADVAPTRSVTYKSVSGAELKMDAFEPAGFKARDRRPAIVFFFGGGWTGGSPSQFHQQAKVMADQGMVAFSADYRVASRNKTTPFECVKDGKSAIRWVREHATELGIDPDRIVAAGGSAGGHVAACTSVIEGHEELGEKATMSSIPNAMILFNPVLDTTAKGYGAKKFKPEQQTDLSPCHHVRKGIVPTIVFHGTADKTVPFENAERFTKLMKEAGNVCVLVPFEDKDHGFFNGAFFRKGNGDADFNLTMKHSIEFLKTNGILK